MANYKVISLPVFLLLILGVTLISECTSQPVDPKSDIIAKNIEIIPDESINGYRVPCSIYSKSGTTYASVTVKAVLYDSNGNVIGAGTFTSSPNTPIDGSSAFMSIHVKNVGGTPKNATIEIINATKA